MGHHGGSYLEGLILYEQWAGHRLLSENVTRPHVRAHRQFLFLLSLCRKELKFGTGAVLLVVHLVDFCLVMLVDIFPA